MWKKSLSRLWHVPKLHMGRQIHTQIWYYAMFYHVSMHVYEPPHLKHYNFRIFRDQLSKTLIEIGSKYEVPLQKVTPWSRSIQKVDDKKLRTLPSFQSTISDLILLSRKLCMKFRSISHYLASSSSLQRLYHQPRVLPIKMTLNDQLLVDDVCQTSELMSKTAQISPKIDYLLNSNYEFDFSCHSRNRCPIFWS
jgi:hypothetical protein